METIEDCGTFKGGTVLQKKVLDATILFCAVCSANSVRVTGYVMDNELSLIGVNVTCSKSRI